MGTTTPQERTSRALMSGFRKSIQRLVPLNEATTIFRHISCCSRTHFLGMWCLLVEFCWKIERGEIGSMVSILHSENGWRATQKTTDVTKGS